MFPREASDQRLRFPSTGGAPPHRPSIRFEGPWTPLQRQSVETAARTIDSRYPPMASSGGDEPSWICLCFRVRETTCFMAHWVQRAEVITACSPEELIEKMRRLARKRTA